MDRYWFCGPSFKIVQVFAIVLMVLFFMEIGYSKTQRQQRVATLGEVSCRVDSDCILVPHPCEGKEACSREFKEICESRILENAKKGSCPYVPYYIYQQKMKAQYEAHCVNKVCQARRVTEGRGNNAD